MLAMNYYLVMIQNQELDGLNQLMDCHRQQSILYAVVVTVEILIRITIADIVTRYRFQLQAYKQTNNTTPTEVYFSEYIAAPILLPVTYYSLTKEVNQHTHFRFEFDSPYYFYEPLTAYLRIKIQFLNTGGWADNLGYQANTIYKNFPCVFSDDRIYVNPPIYNLDIQCDLYTYTTGPHASLTKTSSRGPFIIVSGFSDRWYVGDRIRLELGRFLIDSNTKIKANVKFSLIQETPTMLTKYIELYYNEFTAFTTTNQNVASFSTSGVTAVLASALINQIQNHTITMTAPSTFFAILYEYDKISTPSFTNGQVPNFKLQN